MFKEATIVCSTFPVHNKPSQQFNESSKKYYIWRNESYTQYSPEYLWEDMVWRNYALSPDKKSESYYSLLQVESMLKEYNASRKKEADEYYRSLEPR